MYCKVPRNRGGRSEQWQNVNVKSAAKSTSRNNFAKGCVRLVNGKCRKKVGRFKMASENIFICPHCGLPVDINHLLGERCEEVKDGK